MNIKKYNLANPIDKLLDTEAKIQIYPSIMLAMSDTSIATAYEETSRFLEQYMNSKEEDDEV